MTSICLSVVSNIRCTNLVRWQQVILVIVSSLDVAFAIKFLRVNWHHMRQFHWALVLEVVIYFFLSLCDFLLRQHDGQGIALYLFDAYDEAIGILTIFPLFLFMSAVLLLAHCDILPLTYRHDVRRPALYGLMLLAPPVLVLNVVAGLVGITYVQSLNPPTTITPTYATFSAQFATSLLGDLANIFLALFQIIISGSCIFYVTRAKSRGVGGGVIPGLRWIAIGLLLGVVESLMGLGMVSMGGFAFWLILARRVVRQLSRGALFVGFVQGTSLEQGFVLCPIEPTTPHTQSSLRSNPIMIHTQSYDNNGNPRPMSFGLSDAVENIRLQRPSDARPSDTQPASAQDQAPRPPRPPLPVRLSSKFFANFSHTKSIPKANGPPKPKPGFTAFDPSHLELAEELDELPWNKPGDRVTVQFPPRLRPVKTGDTPAPSLHLRFSALGMPSVNQLVAALGFHINTNTEMNEGIESEVHSVSNGADQGRYQRDLEQQQRIAESSSRRTSLLGLGTRGLARTRLSQVVPRPSEPSAMAQSRAWRRSSVPAGPPPMANHRVSLGVGPVEKGEWILVKREEPILLRPNSYQRQPDPPNNTIPNRRRTRASMAVHSLRRSVDSAMSLAASAVSVSASDTGPVVPLAEIVQARSVTVSTQMSTLLYSPQMGGVVGAQILQESAPPSPRNEIKMELAPSVSTLASSSPRKRMSDIPLPPPRKEASGSGLPRAATIAGTSANRPKASNLAVSGDSRRGLSYSNEAGDYFSFRPQTLDVTGTRVRIRTPTIVSNAETRKSVPLEHGWTSSIQEDPVEDPSPHSQGQDSAGRSSSMQAVQQEFNRFEYNFNQGLNSTDDGDRATISIPPAYENHRRDVLAQTDHEGNLPAPPPVVHERSDSGVLSAIGGLGDLL